MSSRHDSGRVRGTDRGDRDRPRHHGREPLPPRRSRSRSPRRSDYRDRGRGDRRYGGGDRDRRDYGRPRDDDRRERDRRDDRDTRDKRRDDKDRRDPDRDRPRDDRRDRDPPPRRDAPRDRDRDGRDDLDRPHPSNSKLDDRRAPEGHDSPQPSRAGPSTTTIDVTKSRQDSEVPTDGGEEGEEMEVTTADDEAMMAMMGLSGFGTTKGRHVEGNQEGSVEIKKMRTWRQYMNRRGGFNRPLDKIK